MTQYRAEIIKKHPHLEARIMRMTTAHGELITPCFMPVGTRAMLNYLTPEDLEKNGSRLILGGNTYHMLCSPGMDIIQAAGGMHTFMGWPHSMLTDSGGFQVLSLAKKNNLCTVDEDGAHFKHPVTGKMLHLTAQSSVQTQKIIGADIIMAFDECTPENGGRDRAIAALTRTHRWLMLSREEHARHPRSIYGKNQAFFGIIQGGSFQDLREKSAEFILNQEVDGIGIGGEIIGFDMPKTLEIIDWLTPILPTNKIRYTMGVGLSPQDIIQVVAKGIDIFDCVAPTRNARHGTLYYGHFIEKEGWLNFENGDQPCRLLIKKSQYAQDNSPIMPDCSCYTCLNFSRAYLHYLFKQKLLAYFHLASIHNVHVMQETCRRLREIILSYN